jgi:hypothetical protein
VRARELRDQPKKAVASPFFKCGGNSVILSSCLSCFSPASNFTPEIRLAQRCHNSNQNEISVLTQGPRRDRGQETFFMSISTQKLAARDVCMTAPCLGPIWEVFHICRAGFCVNMTSTKKQSSSSHHGHRVTIFFQPNTKCLEELVSDC